MVRQGPLNLKRTSIAWQAGLRLVFSLGLFVILLGLSTAFFYRNAQDNASRERMADLTSFYSSRIAQLEHDWELQSRDFRVRTEYTRILEDDDPARATVRLQAFMTLQGSERRFQYLLIQKRDGAYVFSFGKDLSLRALSLPSDTSSAFYLDPVKKSLYKVYQEPIWLGREMGQAAFFYRIDNGLLQSLTAPDITLTLLHDGVPLASSAGKAGFDRHLSDQEDGAIGLQSIAWNDKSRDRVELAIQSPIKTVFTTAGLSASASMVPIINGLILWFALGLWLMRQSRRIDALGNAVKTFSADPAISPGLLAALDSASRGPHDEIHEVAHALRSSFEQTLERQAERDQEATDRALWSSVFHSSGDAIIITDPAHHIVTVNRAFEEKMGYSLAEVVGQDPRILTDRRESPEFYQNMRQQLRERGFWQGEMWNQHKDGNEHPKLLSISAVRDEQGVVINYVGYYTDISERKQAETELVRYRRHLEELVQERTQELEVANQALQAQATKLRASEDNLNRAQAVAHIGSWMMDVRSDSLYWSDETYRIFGVGTGQSLSYETFIAAVHPDDRPHVDASWQAALHGAPYDIEHRIVVAGQVKWVREQAELEFDDTGTLLGGIGTVQDITERKRHEAEIHALSALQSAILDNAGVSIISTDPQGLITSFNRAAERMLGYQAGEIIGLQTPAIIHDAKEVGERAEALSAELGMDIEPGFDVFVAKSRLGMQNDQEWSYLRKDGSRFPVLLSVTAIRDPKGIITGFLGVATDISERKAAEVALREAKEAAEAASRAKSVFLANMSHELRTPLNAILGFSQLLVRDAGLSSIQREQLGIVNRSGEHLLGLINDILDVSKIEAGKDVLTPLDFNLHQLLESIVAMFRMRAQAKGISCTLSIAPDLPRHVHADDRKLRQILINLLGNAVKFTQAGGVTLRAHPGAGGDPALPRRIILRVEDTGPGIPADEQERIFEPFQQGRHGQDLGEGTGLGLSICHHLVDLMDGSIRMESVAGMGTAFQIELPCLTAGPLPEATADEGHVIGLLPGTTPPKLLIVDDKSMSRLWLRSLLESVGFVVEEAGDGQRAIDCWQRWQPDLILMDLRMPLMDGLEATQRIRSRVDGMETKIIAVTASAFVQDRDNLLAAGCNDFLGKPIREQELFDCLARHLGIQYLHGTVGSASPTRNPPSTLLSGESRKHVPLPVREQLHRALIEGDLQQIGHMLETLSMHDAPLADTLRQLCDGYAYQTILSWLEAGDELINVASSAAAAPNDQMDT